MPGGGGGGGGGGSWDQLPTFDDESKSAKNQISLCPVEEGGGRSGTNFQLLILSLNLLKTKFPYIRGGGGGGGSGTNFQLLMLSLNLLKSKFPYVQWRRGVSD